MRITLAQFNPAVGDIAGNTKKIQRLCAQADELSTDILVLPEMCLCGYPPEDLLHKNHFLTETRTALEQLAGESGNMTVLAGFAEVANSQCYNSLAVLSNGKIQNIYRKNILPNYDVFDEKRYFNTGTDCVSIDIDGINVALTICEDIWQFDQLKTFLKGLENKDIIVNISASPFHIGKINKRREVLSKCAKHFDCPVCYCNLVGGQDELVFDGRSMFIDAGGKIISQAKAFEEDMLIADVALKTNAPVKLQSVKAALENPAEEHTEPIAEVYNALLLGTRDYVTKNGFKKVLIGLSGGIDSALTAAIAVDALGKENVIGVTMPSRFNLAETISDAEILAENLGIEFHTVPIAEILDKFSETLGLIEGWDEQGTAYENLQARIRGGILMSMSNKFFHMVMTTGNKSETAVGYSTLYGDTAGGFAVIKDVPKTMVYKLSEYVNKLHDREVIPQTTIDRPPSAELRENQKDSDSLPDYDLLDAILKGYIEEDKSAQQLIDTGLPEDVIDRVITLVDRNEYKRRQSPPGVKITPKAFGKDRRMPITNRYTHKKD